MLLSSGRSQGWPGWLLVGGAVAEHGPQRVDAPPGEGDEGLLMRLALGSFTFVERSRRGTVLQAGQRGEVAGPHQPAVEAFGSVMVAADPAGVAGCRGE